MNRQTLCTLLCCSWLAGCASPPSMSSIRSGESVDIAVMASAPTGADIAINNQALGSDTTTGVHSGLVAGGLWGLSCGPLAVLCVPLGAAAGALTGTVAGAAVGVTGALSEESSSRLRERVNAVRQSHDVLGELRSNITERAGKHWTLQPGASLHVLSVEMHELALTSTRDERIGFVLRATVSLRDSSKSAAESPKQKLYEYSSPLSPLSVWMDPGSDFIDTSLRSATQQIATQIVAELALR